jgi:hypothetical protein
MRGGALAVALTLLALSPALGQETTTGSIAGRVLDPQEAPVPGASVSVRSDQGSRDVATDADGRFYLPYLTPGVYSVRVELTGFSPVERQDVIVRLGQRVALSFRLEVGTLEEVVMVRGESPVVDVSSTTAGGVLDSAQLQALPVGRKFTQALYMVPGVSDGSGVGEANPSIGGASGLNNSYIVDGVNITNTGYGGIGVYTTYFGSLGTGVTTDFIEETQVKSAGFEAEYGQANGGIVNVITKSGSNVFHGSLYGYWQPGALASSWRQLETPGGTVNTTAMDRLDVGVSAGGPLVTDRLFAFGAFNPQFETRTLIAPDDVEQFPLRALGDTDRDRRSLSYAAKLTWQVSGSHRLDLSVFGDPSYGAVGPQRGWVMLNEDTSAFSELTRYGGHNQALRYNGILTNSWMLEAMVGRASTIHDEAPSVDEALCTDYTVVPTQRSGGIGFYEAGTEGSNLQLSLKSTNLFGVAGRHELRYGVQYEDISFTKERAMTGPGFTFPTGTRSVGGANMFVLPDPALGQFYERFGFTGAPPVTTQHYLSWFVQDSWQIAGRLTLRPGIRWERQTLIGGDPPLCHDDEERVGDGGSGQGNPVRCEYTWTDNWGPRLGAVFDLTGSGRAKLFASAGRFYIKIPNDLAERAMSGQPQSYADYYDAALTEPIPNGVLAGGYRVHVQDVPLQPALFANDSRLTHTDEIVAGLEVEAAPGLSLGVRYIHRDMSTVLEDYAQAQPLLYYVQYPGVSEFVEYLIDNIAADLETIDPTDAGIPQAFFEDPVHTYDAIEITATKAYSGNWSLFASYRWSRLRGNFEGFYRADNGQSDPALTSLFDFPTNDVSYTQIGAPEFGFLGDIRYQGTTLGNGRLPNDRPHQLKVFGTYTWGGLNLGAGLNVGSGRLLTALAANPWYLNRGEIPMTLRGTGFETVDGFQERASADVLLDLHIDYAFRLGASRLQLIADVFNVFDDREPTYHDPNVEQRFGVINPDFGYPVEGKGTRPYPSYRSPRQVRLGVRFEW